MKVRSGQLILNIDGCLVYQMAPKVCLSVKMSSPSGNVELDKKTHSDEYLAVVQTRTQRT